MTARAATPVRPHLGIQPQAMPGNTFTVAPNAATHQPRSSPLVSRPVDTASAAIATASKPPLRTGKARVDSRRKRRREASSPRAHHTITSHATAWSASTDGASQAGTSPGSSMASDRPRRVLEPEVAVGHVAVQDQLPEHVGVDGVEDVERRDHEHHSDRDGEDDDRARQVGGRASARSSPVHEGPWILSCTASATASGSHGSACSSSRLAPLHRVARRPSSLTSRFLRTSPSPGIPSSTLAVMRLPRSSRWNVMAKRWASSRMRCRR